LLIKFGVEVSSYRKHWHAWVDLIGVRWNVG
jgi:hypothetical protein